MSKWFLRLGITISVMISLGSNFVFAQENFTAKKYDWTGFYLGGHVGGVTVKDKLVGNISGISGGVLAGYQYQFDNIVIGAESDLYWGDLMKRGTISGLNGLKRVDWGSTIRLRAGYAINDWQIFASGGFATAQVTVKGSNPFISVNDNKTHYGYVLSTGVEKAVADNWRIRAEYTYGDFNGRTYSLGPARLKFKGAAGHGARIAVSYRFQ